MSLLNAIIELQAAYTLLYGSPPEKITLGREVYFQLQKESIIQRVNRDRILGMLIEVDPRDDYKIAIEDYRRYQEGHCNFLLRD